MSLLLLASPPLPAAPPTVPALTTSDLLAVVDRVIPESYLQPIKDVGPGYELYQGGAKVMERCSLAASRFGEDIYILTSRGGVLATVPVTFFRASAGAGAVIMLAGTIVRASRGGQTYRTASDAIFGAADLVAAPVLGIATGYGYEWNIAGPYVDREGAVWPGELDMIDLPLQSPVFGDPTVQVRNDEPADGLGRPRTLDALGGERDLPRHANESDVTYRVRIRTLPDTITPAAIKRQLVNYFRILPGLFFRHVETWTHEYQECFDAPSDTSPIEPFDPNLFTYDDPRPPSPIRNRWLGLNDHLGAFIVEVQMPEAFADFGFAFDDPAANEADVTTVVGIRALSAFDVVARGEPSAASVVALTEPSLPPAYDGRDFKLEDYLGQLWDLLDQIKPAGSFVVIHLQELIT